MKLLFKCPITLVIWGNREAKHAQHNQHNQHTIEHIHPMLNLTSHELMMMCNYQFRSRQLSKDEIAILAIALPYSTNLIGFESPVDLNKIINETKQQARLISLIPRLYSVVEQITDLSKAYNILSYFPALCWSDNLTSIDDLLIDNELNIIGFIENCIVVWNDAIAEYHADYKADYHSRKESKIELRKLALLSNARANKHKRIGRYAQLIASYVIDCISNDANRLSDGITFEKGIKNEYSINYDEYYASIIMYAIQHKGSLSAPKHRIIESELNELIDIITSLDLSNIHINFAHSALCGLKDDFSYIPANYAKPTQKAIDIDKMLDDMVSAELPPLNNANYKQLYPTYNTYFMALIEHNKLRAELKQRLIAEQAIMEGVSYE